MKPSKRAFELMTLTEMEKEWTELFPKVLSTECTYRDAVRFEQLFQAQQVIRCAKQKAGQENSARSKRPIPDKPKRWTRAELEAHRKAISNPVLV